MRKDHTFTIERVGSGVWEPILARALKGLSPDERRTAGAIVTSMHNRHVGVTPLLAVDLAVMFRHARVQSAADGPWEKVLRRLCRALASESNPGAGPDLDGGRKAFGLLLKSNPLYTVFRMAMPMVEYACGQIGESLLFCEDEEVRGVDRKRYQAYANALHHTIMAIAEDAENRHAVLELFWKAKAASLSSFSRTPSFDGRRLPAPAEEDPIALSFLFRLDPEIPAAVKRPRPRARRSELTNIHRTLDRKEGGVEGIHHTRREEDLDAILLSEFINNEIILLDHLVNSGFFALQRKPKREKKRDALIVGMIPGVFRETLRAEFIRACWFEFLMRLSVHLRARGLGKSEFRWIEGNRLGGFRSSASILEETPAMEGIPRERVGKAWRQFFLTATRWLPAFVNDRDPFTPIGDAMGRPGPGESIVDEQSRWAFAAWGRQRENEAWGAFDPGRSNGGAFGEARLRTHRFSMVHIMLFLSENGRDRFNESGGRGLGGLVGGLRLGDFPGARVSITWVPDTLEEATGWGCQARGLPGAPLFPADGGPVGARKIAGRLIDAWLSRLIEEI